MKLLKTSKIRGRSLAASLFCVAASAAIPMAANAASITIDSVAQRWPWNNKVDITYTVSGGQDVAAGVYARIEFTANIAGTEYLIDGVHDIGASASDGTHTVTWKLPAGVRSDNCTMTAKLLSADNPSGDDYLVVDLATGEVSYEGLLDSQSASNDRYNTDAVYKTTKMVFRKVPRWADRASLPNAASLPANGYPTGDSVNFSTKNSRKDWATSRDYYAGIFIVTRAQYETVVGSIPSGGETGTGVGDVVAHRPVQQVSWNMLRGSIAETNSIVPNASGTRFFERLNGRTKAASSGITGFDLPTEVMWEIAARAGGTSTYFWGADSIDLAVATNYVVSADSNSPKLAVAVGSRLPNSWGLYDVSGDVYELCRDSNGGNSVAVSNNLANNSDPFIPYFNAANADRNNYAMLRGGASRATALSTKDFKLSCRDGDNSRVKTQTAAWFGFRAFLYVD